MSLFPVAAVVFFICVLASRFLTEKAYRKLDDTHKLKLVDSFSSMRAYSMVPMLLIVGVMFGLPYLAPSIPAVQYWSLAIGLALCLVYVVVLHLLVMRKMSAIQLPDGYIREFLIARHISHFGIFIFFAMLLLEW